MDVINAAVNQQLESIQSTSNAPQEVAAIAEEGNASVHEQTSAIQNIDDLAEELEAQAQTLNQQIRQLNVS